MSLRFRKSISLGGGSRINIGKSGFGFSSGVRGLRVGTGPRGSYFSAGIPGTGLYSVSKMSKNTTQKNASTGLVGCLFIVVLGFIFYAPIVALLIFVTALLIFVLWKNMPQQKVRRKITKAQKLAEEDKYQEAIYLLQEAENLRPQDPEVKLWIGTIMYDMGDFKDARSFLEFALEKYGDILSTKLLLADCYRKTEHYKEAISLLQKLPPEQQLDLRAIELLGACFAEQKQYDLAIEVFKKAPLKVRNLDASLIEVHYNLASIYEAAGDHENALKHYTRVYAANADYRDVKEKVEGKRVV